MKQRAMFWPLLDVWDLDLLRPLVGLMLHIELTFNHCFHPCVLLCLLLLLASLVHLRREGVLVSKHTVCSSYNILYTYGFWTTEALYTLLTLCVCVCVRRWESLVLVLMYVVYILIMKWVSSSDTVSAFTGLISCHLDKEVVPSAYSYCLCQV